MIKYKLMHILFHPFMNIKEVYLHIKWAFQRVYRGWDDRAAYGIDFFLAKIVPELIEGMKKYGNSYPKDLTPDEWIDVLNEISDGFKAAHRLQNDDFPAWNDLTPEDWEKDMQPKEFWDRLQEQQDEAIKTFYEGLDKFAEHFFNLWD